MDEGLGEATTDEGFGEATTDECFGEATTVEGSGEATTDECFGEATTEEGFGEATTDEMIKRADERVVNCISVWIPRQSCLAFILLQKVDHKECVVARTGKP